MRIKSKLYCNWDNKTKERLKQLVLFDGYLRNYIVAAPKSRTYVAYSRTGEIMGWLLVLKFDGRNEANIYVDPKWRRRGIATALVARAIKRHILIHLYYWNPENQALFWKLRSQFFGNVIVECWWPVEAKHSKWIRSLNLD